MKKRWLLFIILFIFIIFGFSKNTYAANLDEIVNFSVKVDPRMNDGSLDIIYEITWRVLDSTTEGPLEWVQIGTPNSNFDSATALTNNIKSISQFSGANVKIVFTKKYYAGEELTFRYKIHQSSMYKISWGNCNYEFTPAWFTDARVDNLTVMWNKDGVKSSNADVTEGGYLTWNKTNMANGEKLRVKVKYDKSAFTALSTNSGSYNSYNGYDGASIFDNAMVYVLIIIAISAVVLIGRHRRWRRILQA